VLAHRQGLVNDADSGYRQALDDAKLATDRVLEGAALAQLSKLSRERNDRVAALRYVKAALKLSGRVKDKLTRAVALYNLAMVDAADGQLADAKGALTEAREAFAAFAGVEVAMVDQAQDSLDHREDPSTTPGEPDQILRGRQQEQRQQEQQGRARPDLAWRSTTTTTTTTIIIIIMITT